MPGLCMYRGAISKDVVSHIVIVTISFRNLGFTILGKSLISFIKRESHEEFVTARCGATML